MIEFAGSTAPSLSDLDRNFAELEARVDEAGGSANLSEMAGPVREHGTWYEGDAPFGGPIWVMENFEQAAPIINRLSDVNRVLFVDPVGGNDANPGSIEQPKRTLNTTLWSNTLQDVNARVAYDLTVLKRGVNYTHNMGPNEAIQVGTNQHLGSYGDFTAPRPVVRSLNNGSQYPWVIGMFNGPHCSVNDIDVDASDFVNRSGIVISNGTREADLYDVMISNVRITGVVQTGAILRCGVRLVNNNYNMNVGVNRTIPYPTMYDITLANVDVIGASYTGFHSSGMTGKVIDGVRHGIRYHGCKALDCSYLTSGHGFGSFAFGTVRDRLLSYEHVTGTTYRLTTAQIWGYMVPTVESVYQRVISPGVTYYRLRKNTTSLPSAIARGEFAFDFDNQFVYLNVGHPLPTGVNNGFLLDACTTTSDGILYDRCTAARTRDARSTPTVPEGHGIAFDDFTSNSMVINCDLFDNAGLGVSMNRGYGNRVYNSRLINNGAGAIGGITVGARVWGNWAEGPMGPTEFGVPALLSLTPPVYMFRDMPNVLGGFRRLKYTGTDPAAFLCIGARDFNAPANFLEMSAVDPGVGRVHGFGPGTNEGGYVLARGLVPLSEARRVLISPRSVGW